MRVWLSGATTAAGVALRERLAADAVAVCALSRRAHPEAPGLQWIEADLASAPPAPADCAAWINLGPLDAFVSWLQRQPRAPALQQILSLSSTSVHTKRDSSAAAERALAQRLADAESALQAEGARLGVGTTLLRPTLIYGGANDLVARIGALAARWHVYPWLLGAAAHARRQPVHAADLASAVHAAWRQLGRGHRAYDLPGGETLTLRQLIRRAALAGSTYAMPVPLPAGWLLRLSGGHAQAALQRDSLARMARDQLFDAASARAELGYQPRSFQPSTRS